MKAEGYKFPAVKESDAMFSADTAPQWVNADVCHRCRVGFSVVMRKHHCRACGNVFCHQCSSKQTRIPKLGFEKEVRVCEACYELHNKPQSVSPHVKYDETLPVEYVTSSLAQQTQVPKSKKTDEELKEEEDMQLALALSQSEAEAREKEKKRVTNEIMNNTATKSKAPMVTSNDEEDEDPELARYLNRSYWEKKQIEKGMSSEKKNLSPDHFRISPGGPPSAPTTPTHQLENGEVSEAELNEFVSFLKSQVEIFVNRMKSNSSRGRNISNDSSVQTLFMNVTKNHSTLLHYIHQQDDQRVYYEGLQDKLAQVKDATMALDALREEHREKLRREAEEAERLRQLQMAQKLEIMRRRKQEYLQFQRQLAIQKVQEQEREMQMRQEQQKQQYLMGNIGVPQHVAWDSTIPPMQTPPAQYGQQYQSVPGGYVPNPGYSMPGPSSAVAQQPASMTMPGSAPPGVIPSHPQVLPHTGMPMQHQDQQPPRGPPQGLPQQPRMMAPPQQSQGGPLPNSNQLPPMHPAQIPANNFHGMPLPAQNPMFLQSRSLVMPPGGAPPTVGVPSTVPGNMNMPPTGATNVNMAVVNPQVAGMKQRLPQNVGMTPMPVSQGVSLPHGVVMPHQPVPQGSQPRLPPGMGMPPGNVTMMPASNGPVNGQANMGMPPPGQPGVPSLPQTQPQPQQQAPSEQNETKTEELIRFD
ncbi:UNVERIFIED_CONTAM: hypothetical protein PYX00_000394 [Menopon gallinae]